MAINIAQNQNGQAPEVRLPDVSGANVADVTTAPSPLAGTPSVNPFENPYASAPFVAAEKAAGQVGDVANKAFDYFNDLNTANQAMKVDTQRSSYRTLQMKSVNDINALARQQGWSDDQDRVQKAYASAHDTNWAKTVGSVNLVNPTVKRYAARLEMADKDSSERDANSFFASEHQSGVITAVTTQKNNLREQYQEELMPQPGESHEASQARALAATQRFESGVAALGGNAMYQAALPKGRLDADLTEFGFNSEKEALVAVANHLKDPEVLGFGANKDANDAKVADAKQTFSDFLGTTGLMSKSAQTAMTLSFSEQLDKQRAGAEHQAIVEQAQQQHQAYQTIHDQLQQVHDDLADRADDQSLTLSAVTKAKNDALKQVNMNAPDENGITLDPHHQQMLRDEIERSDGHWQRAITKQNQAKADAAFKQQIGLGAGERGAVDGAYTSAMKNFGVTTFNGLQPQQQSQLMTGLLSAQGGSSVARTLPTALKGEFDTGVHSLVPLDPNNPNGPTQADRYASYVDNLRTTAPLAYADLDKPTRDIATRIVTDRQPAKDAIAAVMNTKIDLNPETTKENQRSGLKSLGFENGVPKKPEAFLAPIFDQLHSLGQDVGPDGNKVDTTSVPPSVMSSYVREIQDNISKGMTPESARITAANTLVQRGFGITTLGGNNKPTITLRSAENIAGAPALSAPGVLEADIRNYAGPYVRGHPASEAGSVTSEAGTEYFEAQPYQARSGIPADAPVLAEPVPGQFDAKGNQVMAVAYKDKDTGAWIPVVRTAANGQQVPYSFDQNNNYALRNQKATGEFNAMQSRYLAEEAREAQSKGQIKNGDSWGRMGMQGVGEAGALTRFLPEQDAAKPLVISRNDQNFPQSKEAFKSAFAEKNKGNFDEEMWNRVNK